MVFLYKAFIKMLYFVPSAFKFFLLKCFSLGLNTVRHAYKEMYLPHCAYRCSLDFHGQIKLFPSTPLVAMVQVFWTNWANWDGCPAAAPQLIRAVVWSLILSSLFHVLSPCRLCKGAWGPASAGREPGRRRRCPLRRGTARSPSSANPSATPRLHTAGRAAGTQQHQTPGARGRWEDVRLNWKDLCFS